MNNELPEYLSLSEVVGILKVHPNTLRNWDRDGVLKAARIGKRKIRRWRKDDIINFMEKK